MGGTIDGVIRRSEPCWKSRSDNTIRGRYDDRSGHGRLCDMADVGYYRDMVTIIRGRVQDLIKKGQTLEQVKAAKPTRDYDGRFGATTGAWTTDMFVEAVYRTLAPARK